MRFSTKAIHAGQSADPTTGATIIPIYQTSTYTQQEIGIHKGYEYSRTGNPTRTALETCLASLEEGKHGLAFASGLAATMAVLSVLRPGEHVVAAEDLYGGTWRLFEKILRPQKVNFTYVDGRDPAAFKKGMQSQTKMVWIETPTNPLLHLTDIGAVAALCAKRKIPLVVDNTFASPYLQRPLTLGATVCMHSTTKYLGGHSDVVGGAVITSDDELHAAIKFYQNAAGGVPGPFDAWLALRGVRTLGLRMRQHCQNAQTIAEFLSRHSRVETVYYPGLPSHPQHEIACRQMHGAGGMVSFALKGGREQANAFVRSLKVFAFAESLGGVESLACHPATMTHGSVPAEERERRGISEALVRLSVGIEDPDDLVEDLAQALDQAG